MSDPSTTTTAVASTAAAEFFKNKKKKGRKVFTFNANLVDADTVTQTIHVDAPALSNDPATDGTTNASDRHSTVLPSSMLEAKFKHDPSSNSNNSNSNNNSEWDDTAVVSSIGNAATTTSLLLEATTTTTTTATATTDNSVSVLNHTTNGTNTGSGSSGGGVSNIGTLSTNEYYYDDTAIAEKLRVEETRAQLAAARMGMERQAAAAAAQKEADAAKKNATTASAVGSTGGGGRWVPAHLRNPTVSSGTNRFGGGTASTKLDVASNELFPDLPTAMDHLETTADKQAAAPLPSVKPTLAPPTKIKKLNMNKIVPSLVPKKKKISVTPTTNVHRDIATTTTTTTTTTVVVETPTVETGVDQVVEPVADTATTATTTAVISSSLPDDPTLEVSTSEPVVLQEATPVLKKSTTIKKKKKDLSTFKASS